MSKYDDLKFLKETKARKLHNCSICGCEINTGNIYYRESIGRVNAPGIKLETYCYNCEKERLNDPTAKN